MADTFQLEVVTPEKILVKDSAEEMQLPGKDGYLGILPGHAPLITELAIGKMVVDLRAVDFSGQQRAVHASVGIGDLDVLVPDGVRVVVDGHAGAGSVSAFGRRTETCCPTDIRRVRPGIDTAGTLRIDAEVGAGTVEVKR